MFKPNPKRTEFILDLLTKQNYDYVWLTSLKTFKYEMHTNENVPSLDMSDSGDALALLKSIKKKYVHEEYQKEFDKRFSAKKLIKTLRQEKEVEYEFPFSTGFNKVKIFYFDESQGEFVVCAKLIEEEEEREQDDEHEALMILELDSRKRFSIKNVNENISKVFNISLLKFSKTLKHDAFAGFSPEDRVRAQKIFLDNAIDGNEFEDDFRVFVSATEQICVHCEALVKKINKSYIYYLTITRSQKYNNELVLPEDINLNRETNPRRTVHSFDIDLVTSAAHLGLEMRKYYHWDSVVENFPESFIEKGLIYPDDAENLKKVINYLKEGSPHEELDLRVKNLEDNTYVWRSIILNTVFDDSGKAVRTLGYSEDISSYKDQEIRFHDVLEMCGFTTWNLDLEKGRITNGERLKKLFGLSEEHLENAPESLIASGAIHNDDIETIREMHQKIENGETSVSCEFRGKNIKGGSYNWYNLRYTLVNDKNGRITYAIGSTTDINDQKIAELSYEYEAKTLYEMQGDTLVEKCCVNVTCDEITSFSSNQNIEYGFYRKKYSEVLKTMMNFCANEETSRLLWNKLNPEYLLQFYAQGNKTFSFVHRRMTANNNLQWVSTKVNMYQDPKTSEIIAFVYTYDINRKKLSQEALEMIGTSDFDLVGIVDVIGGGVVFLHDNGIMSRVPNWDCPDYDLYFEQYADRMRPYLESEEDYISLHDRIKISSLVKELDRNSSFEIIIKHRRKDASSVTIYRTTFRYLDAEQSSIVLCMSDITSALAEEQEREKVLKNALEQANIASHAKTDFLARMSHDIRTPLNGIMGMTQLAMEENDADLIHEYLEKIDVSSKFLLGLLNDILDMSKIEKGVINLESDVYSLVEFRENLDSIIVPLCRNKDITLNVDIEGDCSFITDKQKFNQIFFNLLSNSVKFTEIGGRIDVLSQNQKIQDGKLYIDFVVQDFGCGITEEFKSHMFEAFSQEKNNMVSMSQGTGLGLSIVKSLVEKMGGTIDVWSSVKEEDHGTRTTVHFALDIAQ